MPSIDSLRAMALARKNEWSFTLKERKIKEDNASPH